MKYKRVIFIIISFILSFFSLFINIKLVKGAEGYWTKITDELYGGYINYFTIDPINSNTIYVATNNGLFITIDSGKNWQNIGLNDYSLNSIDVDENNPKIIYVSTEGNGIFKTIDGGNNWFEINNGILDLNVKFVKVDKKNSDILYAITWSGIFKSIDQGKIWTKKINGLTNFRINSLIIDTKNNNILYLGTWGGKLNP